MSSKNKKSKLRNYLFKNVKKKIYFNKTLLALISQPKAGRDLRSMYIAEVYTITNFCTDLSQIWTFPLEANISPTFVQTCLKFGLSH